MVQETLKTRMTSQAQNVQLRETLRPGSNGGSVTPIPAGFVSGPTDYSWIANDAADLLNAYGKHLDAADKARKQQAQTVEDAQLAQFDMDVYNIQTNPEMSASEKEIRVQDRYNQYPNLPVAKKHSVLSAHNADVAKTYMNMSEQQYKKDVVEGESNQRKQYSELAVTLDPYNATLSPQEQYKKGREYMNDLNQLRTAMNAISLNPNNPDIVYKYGEEGAQYLRQLMPQEFRRRFVNGQLTQQDLNDAINNFAIQIQGSVNPVTGTTYSATEAFGIASNVFNPMYKGMLEEKDRVSKLTQEIQKSYDEDFVNNLMKAQGIDTWLTYKLVGKDPATLNSVLGISANDEKWQQIKNSAKLLSTTEQGRLKFDPTTPNEFLTLMSQNTDMPDSSMDANIEMYNRQEQAPQTPSTSMNLLEQMRGNKGFYTRVPDNMKQGVYNTIKQAVASDMAQNTRSLIIRKVDNTPTDAPWYQKVAARGYNTVLDISENIGLIDTETNNRQIDSMVKDYVADLRGLGMSHQEATDIIQDSLKQLGIDGKEFKPLSDADVPYFFRLAIDGLKSSPLTRGAGLAIQKGVKALASNEGEGGKANLGQTTVPEQQTSQTNTDSGKVNMSSIYNTKEYREVVSQLAKQGKEKKITREQAQNEVGQLVSRVAKELFGAKEAKADTIPYKAGNNADDYGDKPMSKVDIMLDEYYKASQQDNELARHRAEQAVLDKLPDVLSKKEIKEFYDTLLSKETDLTTQEERLAMNQDDRQPSNQLSDRKKRKNK